ncbi:MAG: COQ9 family protein [Rhodospirillaceae bacterium]
MDTIEIRDALLEATLPNVLFDGWTDHALRGAAHTAGIGVEAARRACPGGIADLALWFSDWADRRMVARYAEEDTARLGAAARVALAVRLRLEVLSGHREAVRSWLLWLALPPHAPQAAKLLSETVDEIWQTVGDSATDFSYYTKRAMLAAIYSAVLLHWLGDESEGHAATWSFLDRSLKAIAKAGRSAAQIGGFGKLLGMVPSPVRFGRQMRRRLHGRA